MADTSTKIEVGDVVDDRYEIVRVLEEGEFGCVCDVEHVRLGQPFTLKVVYRAYGPDSSPVRRLQQEARATSLVQHEHAVFVTDVGRCREFGSYLVTERRSGKRLSAVLSREKWLNVADAVRIAMDAASAVASAHDVGVIHRDLTPESLLVEQMPTGDFACRVMGFGVEGTVIEDAGAPGSANPEFRAPELRLGATPDAKSDQFSLGAIAYRMLTGQNPAESDVDGDSLAVPSDFNPKVPRAVDEAVLRSLSRAPSSRFDTVEAFIDAMVEPSSGGLTPRSDPLDGSGLAAATDGMTEAGMGVASSAEPASLIISLDELEAGDKKRLQLTFQTHERLRREYRRNIVAGGVFVPTSQAFELHDAVELGLGLVDGASVEVDAEVVSIQAPRAGSQGGVGLALSSEAVEALGVFVRKRAGLDLKPTDRLRATDGDLPDDLSRAEGYLVSRLSTSRSLADIRREASGLPFDLASELTGLVERGLVDVDPDEGSGTSEASTVGLATEPPTEAMSEDELGIGAVVDFDVDSPWEEPIGHGLDESSRMDYTDDEVERVMVLVDYQVRRQNYLAAIRTLQKAIVVSPAVAAFHHRLAALHLQFTGDEEKAHRALQGALNIEPQNAAIRRTAQQLERSQD